MHDHGTVSPFHGVRATLLLIWGEVVLASKVVIANSKEGSLDFIRKLIDIITKGCLADFAAYPLKLQVDVVEHQTVRENTGWYFQK